MSVAISSPRFAVPETVSSTGRLSGVERLLLGIGIFEIPLQIDKYFLYHERDTLLGAVGGLNVSVTTLMLALLYALWIAQLAIKKPLLKRPLVVGWPMVLYLAAIALSLLSASVAWLSVFDWWIVFQGYLLFFYIANRATTLSDLHFCLLVLCAALVTQSFLIFSMAAMGVDEQEITLGPLVVFVAEGARHGGTMQSPVLAGSTMALLWLPVAAMTLCVSTRWLWRAALFTSIAGMLAILLTQTRGAILTSAVGSVLICGGLLSRGWLPRWSLVLAIVLALLSVYPLVLVYQKRIKDGDGDSAIARKHLSLIALELIEERPLLGYGAGNCHIAAERVANQAAYRSEWFYTIHCKYLLVWIETGLVGLLAFFCVLGRGVWQGLCVWRLKHPLIAPIGLALSAAIAGHSVHMWVDIFNSRTQVQTLWVILGLTAATYAVARVESEQGLRRRQTLGSEGLI